jgi:hypothetical protein
MSPDFNSGGRNTLRKNSDLSLVEAGVRQADTSEDEFFVDTEAHHPTNQGSHARKEIPS